MYSLRLILMLLIIIVIPAFIYTYFFLLQRPQITPPSSADHPPARAAVALGKSDLVTVVFVAKSEEAEGGGECAVCLSAFEAGEELWQLNLCRHLFHAPCIKRWLHAHSNCPVCRAYVKAPPHPPKDGAVAPAATRAPTSARDDFWQGLPDSAGLV